MREIAINLTDKCNNSYSLCYAKELYSNLLDIRYISSSKYQLLYNPIYTYNTKSGDCKNVATLYVSLLESIGVQSEVVCSYKYNHCIAKVPIKYNWERDYEKYIVIDLAVKPSEYGFVVLNKSTNLWNYRKYWE